MKLIVVASDFSGLGKGTFCGALGCALQAAGKSVAIMKLDLYYNYDAGTINPGEHGEVYVLADGTETDQDLGIYERFLFRESNEKLYLTSGRVHHQIYLNERAGKYLGSTVSVEHVIEEIKDRICRAAEDTEVLVIELGATIGDIKGIFFREAIRQLHTELPDGDLVFILLSLFPYLANVGELKTMGCQRSVASLRSDGIQPDFIIARTSDQKEISDYQASKIKRFCELSPDDVFCLPDLHEDIFHLPDIITSWNFLQRLEQKLKCKLKEPDFSTWRSYFTPRNDIHIALAGKYPHDDAYLSIYHQLLLNGVHKITFISDESELNESFSGVIVPGGWGTRGVGNLIKILQVCRERNLPCLGICLGMQLMVIENAHNVAGIPEATSEEFDPESQNCIIAKMLEQKKAKGMGATARLGNELVEFTGGTKLAQIYDNTPQIFRHRHRYEVDESYSLSSLVISARDKNYGFVEAVEYPDKKFFIGVQFHPEFIAGKSKLITAFVEACHP